MRAFFALVITIFSLSVGFASAQERRPWYLDHPHQVTTLQQAIADERAYMRSANPSGGHRQADAETCAALASVGVACDYSARIAFSMFLTVNGKGLFPYSGRTNPYCGPHTSGEPDDCFIGHGRQNAMLREAVLRNASLFSDGELTAEEVRSAWL